MRRVVGLPFPVGRLGLIGLIVSSCTGAPSPDADAVPEGPGQRHVSELSLAEALDVAEATYLRGELSEASALLWPTLERARDAGDVTVEAKALTWLGLAAWRLGDHAEAADLGEQALRLKLDHGLSDELFASYNALGLLAYYENRYLDASEYLEAALQSTNAGGKVGDYATARQNLALVQTEWGDFEAARAGFLAFRDTMVAFADHFDPPDLARRQGAALTNLGMLEVRMGNPFEAVRWLQQALEVYRAGYPAGEGFPLGHLATAYSMLGEQGQAFTVLDTALHRVREQGLRQEEASNLEVLAEQYREAGDYRRALDLYEEAKTINAELNLFVETGADLRGEAEIHLAMGTPELALPAATEALALHEKAGAALEEFYDHIVLGDVRFALGDEARARGHLDDARRLSAALSVRSARVSVALAEARIADRVGDQVGALRVLREAEEDLMRSGYAEQWQGSHLMASAFQALGLPDSALAAGRRALATVERVRGSYGSHVLRSAFSADRQDVYAQLIETLVTLGRIGEAFEVSDAARGRTLEQGVLAAGGGTASDAGRAELRLREIDGVLESIELIETGVNAVDPETDARALSDLYERLQSLRGEYESSLLRAGRIPAGSASDPSASVSEIQEALLPDEALLEFFVPPEGGLRIFVMRPHVLDVVESDLTAQNLRSRVRIARDRLSRRVASGGAGPALEALHASLLGPVLERGLLGEVRRITVVPHGALTYLPFSALRDAETGRYLVEDFDLRVLPTAAAAVALAGRPPGSGRATGVAFAPLPDELPASRAEVRAVQDAVRGVERHEGRRATEPELRRALRDARFVHVATHGVMNSQNPMFSRLLLADGRSGSSDDDGRLEVHELLGIEAAADLVFLSGCETGLGRSRTARFAAGDDYMTLGQAFLRAGVRDVVATLWLVDDEAAAVFAEHFYLALRSSPPREALAVAQRAMRKDVRFDRPYYWAGYQLMGDGSVPLHPQESARPAV